jgi:glycerophosphoryl diester phosphodiesterase
MRDRARGMTAAGAENRWLRPGRPLLLAHRGHITTLPEQTMLAFREAIRLGAEMIEADVHRTRDGRLVMLHDDTLDRTTNGSGPVAARTWPELAVLDAGSWFGEAFRDERIPSLDQLLDLAADTGTGLCLEAKGATHDETVAIAQAVASTIAERHALTDHVLASFDHAALRRARAGVPGLVIAPDRLPERGDMEKDQLIAQMLQLAAPIVQHHHADLTPGTVDALHAVGIAVWAWPVNDPDDIKRCARMGVDGLMGDDVTALIAAATR